MSVAPIESAATTATLPGPSAQVRPATPVAVRQDWSPATRLAGLHRFAAAITSAGFFDPKLDLRRIQDVPLWIFHGDADKTAPYSQSRNLFDELKKLNGNAKFTTLPGVGHGSPNSPAFKYTGDDPEKRYNTEYASDRCDKTDHVWDWLFRQKR